MKDNYSEKDLENAILAELEKFILEVRTTLTFGQGKSILC